MPQVISHENQRIAFRISSEDKAILTKAAELSHTNMTEFMLQLVLNLNHYKSVQGQGLGGQLLVIAVQRCKAVAEQVGGIGLMIDAKNQAVTNWYQSFGATPLHDEPLTLILPFSQFK